MKRSLLAFVFAACAAACGKPPRDDAKAIVRAYEELQGADWVDRQAALDAFAKTRCDDAQTCADRDLCTTYSRTLFRAQSLVRKAKELGPESAGGNGAATPSELALIISGADDASKAATAAEPACQSALQRLYALSRK